MDHKRKLFWPGLFLLSAGWHLLLPVFTTPTGFGVLLLLLGCCFIGTSFLDGGQDLSAHAVFCFFAMAVTIACLTPYPYSLGGVVLLAGVLLVFLLPPQCAAYRIGFGVVVAGIICVVQTGFIALSLHLPMHNAPVLAAAVAALFRFFGVDAAVGANTVFVQAQSGLLEFAISAEYFGWVFLIQTALGVLVWQLTAFARPWRTWLLFIIGATGYALARYLILAFVYLELGTFRIFWDPWIFVGSFAPLFLLLSSVTTTASRQWSSARTKPPGRPFTAAIGFGAAVSLVVLACAWDHPSQIKPGRVLIDESHSAWEQINRAYDTEWFGEESGYNYYCLAEFLGHYYQVRHNGAALTPEVLADCDVLVIKTPTSAFTTDEIDAIESFVRRGGGLLLIGDHTNVFGTSTYLNSLARRFGLHFNMDATYDLASGGLSFYERPRLLPHPVVQRLPPFLFATSCTLDMPFQAAIPINGYSLRVAGHDYSTPSFFSTKTDGPNVIFGVFPQLGAVKFHRGRVAAFTDSTVFSNFWMFLPGKPELLLGCTEWLNRQNRSLPAHVLAALALLLALAAGWHLRHRTAGLFPLMLASTTCGFVAGAHLTTALNRFQYPTPTPRTAYPTICFERQFSRFELPARTLFHEPPRDFHTFYTWVQRVGCVPRVSERFEDAFTGSGLMMLNPERNLGQRQVEQLTDYVRNGGVLFLFASPANVQTANSILKPFDLAFTNSSPASQWLLNAAGELVATNRNGLLTTGGQGLLFTEQHNPVLAIQKYGKGRVVFGGDPELFANSSLGTTSVVPDEQQKRLFKLIFYLFRQALPDQSSPGQSGISAG